MSTKSTIPDLDFNQSQRSTTPFFGRAYSLTITPNNGPSAGVPIIVTSDQFEPHALRIQFDVQQYAYSAFWQASITIWNADGNITQGPSKGKNLYETLIQEGDMVTLCAGYQADYPNPADLPVIWQGPVFYTIQDRIDVIDKRLKIQCLLNRALTVENFLNDTLPARAKQFEQARFIAESSRNKIKVDQAQIVGTLDSVKNQRGADQLPRGKSYFGNPHNYLTALAEQNNLLSWFDGLQWNLQKLDQPINENFITTYAPRDPNTELPVSQNGVKLSLISQPQQTQFGANVRVLLDPTVQIKPPLPQVRVQKQYVRQALIPYPIAKGQGPPRPSPDSDTYVVVGVRFSGDTRGNEWYSEMVCFTQIMDAVALLGEGQYADYNQ